MSELRVRAGRRATSSPTSNKRPIKHTRRHAITDGIFIEYRKTYGKDVSNYDIFYYVYGILHSPEYRTRSASDLKKMLPRIPLTQQMADYKKFTKADRDLAQWHLN